MSIINNIYYATLPTENSIRRFCPFMRDFNECPPLPNHWGNKYIPTSLIIPNPGMYAKNAPELKKLIKDDDDLCPFLKELDQEHLRLIQKQIEKLEEFNNRWSEIYNEYQAKIQNWHNLGLYGGVGVGGLLGAGLEIRNEVMQAQVMERQHDNQEQQPTQTGKIFGKIGRVVGFVIAGMGVGTVVGELLTKATLAYSESQRVESDSQSHLYEWNRLIRDLSDERNRVISNIVEKKIPKQL